MAPARRPLDHAVAPREDALLHRVGDALEARRRRRHVARHGAMAARHRAAPHVVEEAQHVEGRRQRRLAVLVLEDEPGALELPADDAVGRDAAVRVGHLRDEQVDEHDRRDELVRPEQPRREGRRRLVLERHRLRDVEAAVDAPERAPERVAAEDAVPGGWSNAATLSRSLGGLRLKGHGLSVGSDLLGLSSPPECGGQPQAFRCRLWSPCVGASCGAAETATLNAADVPRLDLRGAERGRGEGHKRLEKAPGESTRSGVQGRVVRGGRGRGEGG